MFDVLPTDKQKQERRGAWRWVAQWLGAGRATDTFAVQTHNCPLLKNKYITTKTGRELHISEFQKMLLPWMWMWDKSSLLPLTVSPSPFVFLLLLLNVEACKDTKKNWSVAFIYCRWSLRQIHVMHLLCLLYSRSQLRVHRLCLRLKKFFSLKLWNPRLCFGRCGICLFGCSLFLLEKNLQKLQRNHNFRMMELYDPGLFTGLYQVLLLITQNWR